MSEKKENRGRPRCFCEDAALDAAVQVFWQKGFEGTSLDDLTAALGINRPSLYAAFGNKERLFISAVQHYNGHYRHYFAKLLEQNRPVKQTVEEWLRWSATNLKKQRGPLGCLVVNSTNLCYQAYPAIAKCIRDIHRENERMLRNYFMEAIDQGHLPDDVDATALSQFYHAVVQGMAITRRSQRDAVGLDRIVQVALNAWPRDRGES